MSQPADDFVFILAGEKTPTGGRTYDTVIDTLIASEVDLIFVESGVTARDEVSGGAPTISEDDLQAIRSSDVDSDGTRHAFGYINMAVTDHYRGYWQDRWTLDTNGDAYSSFDPNTNQDARPLNPNNSDATNSWLNGAFGVAEGPPEDGGTQNTVYGYIADFRSGMPGADGAIQEDTWWDIVLDQVEALYTFGYRDFFLDDVGRYFEAAVNSGLSVQELGDAMIALVNAVGTRLEQLGSTADDVTIGINGGGYLRWNNTYGSQSAEVQQFFATVDYLVIENAFMGAPSSLVEIAQNLAGTQTALLSIEWANTVPTELAGTYLALLDAITSATGTPVLAHSPNTPDYSVGPGGVLPADVFGPNAPAPTHNIIIASGFGATILGTAGNDLIFATSGADDIDTGGGDDIIFALGGDDTIHGGDGDDIIIGGDGSDRIFSGFGKDMLFGGNLPEGVTVWDLIPG